MTERKPAGVSWESWVEALISQARERGDFISPHASYRGWSIAK